MIESLGMVKIRLTRTGRKHQPHYRIVAVDSRSKRDGSYIEKIGYYNPRTTPPTVDLDKDILKKWMENGAQLTDTVYDLLVREKIITKKDKLREKRIKLMIEQSKADKEKKTVEEVQPEPTVTKNESLTPKGSDPEQKTKEKTDKKEKPAEDKESKKISEKPSKKQKKNEAKDKTSTKEEGQTPETK